MYIFCTGEADLCEFPPPQSCTPNGLPPAAAHQRHLAARLDGGQQRRDDLPLPVRRLQLSAGDTAYILVLIYVSDHQLFNNPDSYVLICVFLVLVFIMRLFISCFSFTGCLHLLLPHNLQQRGEEEPQERLDGEEERPGRVQHHEGLFAHCE